VSATKRWWLVFVALIAFLMLLISIHSVFLALKGVLMTLLSVGGRLRSAGDGSSSGLGGATRFPPLNSIDSTVPPLVLAITFGLSMDYEIFLLTRSGNASCNGQTRDPVAPRREHQRTTITSAALT